ncbi:MAG: MFS transporter [Clostridia bacterium]|nr:MFS transporter [Clostridia bacterium]
MSNYKLNVKRTIFVGFAFFLISAFWQAYDAIVPLMLTNHFGLSQTASGAIMALDNIFALFMLPIFGTLSDKSKSKHGKRTPFIFLGTVAAIVAFIALTFVDNYQLTLLSDEIKALYPVGVEDKATKEAMLAVVIEKTLEVTLANPWPLVFFIGILLIALFSMATFRSPAVALMPDVTIKPLRSKGNAIINLMGTAGGIFVLVLGMVFKTSSDKNSYMKYTWYIVAVCAIMAIGLAIFLLFVKEKRWNSEMLEIQEKLDKETQDETTSVAEEKLPKEKLKSLLLILASVALWFMGYNAVTSKYSLYAQNVLNQDYNFTLIIAQAAAVISYVPVGIVAGKFGRKKTILAGVAMLATAFFGAIFITPTTPPIVMYLLFALAGIAWATINVNSFPMVVELARGSNIGKYTGFYYTASMSAQVLTPILSGSIMDLFGSMHPLFPYATVFVSLSFVTMLFVKHGNVQDLGDKTAKDLIADNFAGED